MGKKVILLLLVCFAFTLSVNAQGPPGPTPPPPPPPGLPIDGGIIFLLISGVYYGVKKLKK